LRSTAFENCTMKTAPATISARALPRRRSARREGEDLVHMPLRTGWSNADGPAPSTGPIR
jgi:hypothetical protein